MRIAVLGASGRIGFQLALNLRALRPDDQIVPIVRHQLAFASLRPYFDDVDDGTSRGDYDIVINAARSTKNPSTDGRTNRLITDQSFARIGRGLLIQLSSIAVYGDLCDASRQTFARPKPNTVYGLGKRAIESHACSIATKQKKVAIIRLGNVFGIETNWSDQLFAEVMDGSIRLPNNGRQPSNAISTRQFASGLSRLIDQRMSLPRATIWNAAGPQWLTWRRLYDLHSDALGVDPVDAMDQALMVTAMRKARLNSMMGPAGVIYQSLISSVAFGRSSLIRSYHAQRVGSRILSVMPASVVRRVMASAKRTASPGSNAGLSPPWDQPWLWGDRVPTDQTLPLATLDNPFAVASDAGGQDREEQDIRLEIGQYATRYLPPSFTRAERERAA